MRGQEFNDWVQRAKAVPIEGEIERRGIKLRRVGAERVGPCPVCGGDDRFAINVKKQVFNCRGCGIKGDVIALVERLEGCDFNAACMTLAGPPPQANGKDSKTAAESAKKVVVATFEYSDENGDILFAKDRIEFQKPDGAFVLKDDKHDKTFRVRRPDPDRPGHWLHNIDGVRVVPYRLPEMIEAVANDRTIFVVEGEAKADLLWSWNIAATCCAGGAEKWRSEHSEYLRDADVVLVPDNDEPGFKHADKVSSMLSGVAKRVRLLVLPDLPPKGDIKDWADAGGAREQLDALIEQAKDYSRPLVLKTNTADDGDEDTHSDKDRESGSSLLPPPSQPMAVARIFADKCLHGGLSTLCYWRGGWWMWKTTHWIEVEDGVVRSILYRFTENAFYFGGKAPRPWAPNRHKIGDVVDALAGICLLPNDVDQPSWLNREAAEDSVIVSVKNGLLDVSRRHLIPHTPAYFNQTSVPFAYDPKASEPRRWLDFLAELWLDEPDAIDVLGEWFGYVISGRTDLHKILLMVGQRAAARARSRASSAPWSAARMLPVQR